MGRNFVKYIFIGICISIFTSCDNNPMSVNNVCDSDCFLDLSAPNLNLDENGYYHMGFIDGYNQTFTTLQAETGSLEEYQKLEWIANKEVLIDGYWTSIINRWSYTDEEGHAHTVLSAWEFFIGDTISVYSGYYDQCNFHYLDSLKVIVE